VTATRDLHAANPTIHPVISLVQILGLSYRAVVLSGADVAHPLIVSLPRLVPAAGVALRWLAVARLRAMWAGGRLDLEMPGGDLVQLGGSGPADARARIHDDRLWLRLLLRGEMGAGESFVAGEWASDDLVAVIRLFLRATGARGFESPVTWLAQLPALLRHRRAANTPTGSARNVHAHYDLGNAFYQLFLDPDTLSYSCGIGDGPDTHHRKHERLCELLALSPRDHLLEIDCSASRPCTRSASTSRSCGPG
jgi:cyclopropane-fatty-acyl-phospholipid synthase